MKYMILIIMNSVAIILLGISSIRIQSIIKQSQSDVVFAVCNQSRVSAEISEAECGRLQDKWHKEFLCTQANNSPENNCWVEDK